LIRIESRAFSSSSLESILIPRNVQFIDGSAFCNVKLSSITIESGNTPFVVEQNLLIDIIFHKLISNFSKSSKVDIPNHFEIICSSCFSNCKSLSSISLESNSRLTRIESFAFSSSSLQSILIPRNVQFIDGSAFCDVNVSSITIISGNNTLL
jgi:hypothetical protein